MVTLTDQKFSHQPVKSLFIKINDNCIDNTKNSYLNGLYPSYIAELFTRVGEVSKKTTRQSANNNFYLNIRLSCKFAELQSFSLKSGTALQAVFESVIRFCGLQGISLRGHCNEEHTMDFPQNLPPMSWSTKTYSAVAAEFLVGHL